MCHNRCIAGRNEFPLFPLLLSITERFRHVIIKCEMHRLSDHILSLFFFYPYWYISVEKVQVETENSNLAKTHIIVPLNTNDYFSLQGLEANDL